MTSPRLSVTRDALLLVVLVALVPSVRAQSTGILPAIEVTGHYDNGVGTSDAASSGSVNRALIEDRPLLRPAEVLELVPGLVITQHSGAGKANQYYLRGFNLDHGTDFLTNVAGMPVNMRTHAHGQGYTDLNFVIPELVSRIDYFKGPYYASKGDFASAGAADLHYADALPGSIAELTAGSFGYRRAVLAGAPALASGRLVYGVEVFRDDGPWEHPDRFRKFNGVLRYAEQAGDTRWSITGMAYSGRWNATDQVPRRAVDAGLIGRFGTLDPTDGGDSHRYSVSTELSLPVASGRLELSAYAIRYDLDLFSNFTYFLDHPELGDQFEQSDRRRIFGGSGKWTWLARAGSVDTRTTLGFEMRQDRIEPVALYATVTRQRLDTIRADRVRESSGGMYLESETTWLPQLRTIAGVRADAYRFRVDSAEPANSGTATDHRLSPKLSAILGPWQRTELFVNYGHGFHSNDARGVTITADPKTGDAVDRVTPLVRTRGGEVGARTEWFPHIQSSLALWRLDIDSELVFVGDAGTTEPSRPSRRTGLEWNTRWTPASWLLLDLDAAFSRARFSDNDPAGDRIPGAIESVVSAGATVRDLGPWSASLFMRYFGARPLIEDNSVRSSSSTVFNAKVGYRWDTRSHVSLEVFNLFDRRVDDVAYYYASRLGGEIGQGVNDIHFHPAERRSVRLTATYAF